MNKKAIAILGGIFILIVGTLGVLIYSKYSGNKSAPPATSGNNNQPSNQTPPDTSTTNNPPVSTSTPPVVDVNSSKIVKLTDDQVVSPVLFFDGSGITYFNRQGQLLQANLDFSNNVASLTRKRDLGIQTKANISKILWPAKGNNFIAEFVNNGKKSWSFFNSTVGSYIDLPAQVEALDWLPSGDKIIYIWVDNNKATLNIADPDTKNYKHIADLWETDDNIHVSPDGLNIAFYHNSNTTATNAINLTTPDGKLWRALVKDGYNFGVLWSPDGQQFLFQKKDRNFQKYQIWYYNLLTGEIKNLGLMTTLDKVVWGSDNKLVYAAVPQTGTAGGGSLTVDSFFKFNVETFDKKEYLTGSQQIDGRNLFLNLTMDKLFFVNAQDGGLYYLDLNQ